MSNMSLVTLPCRTLKFCSYNASVIMAAALVGRSLLLWLCRWVQRWCPWSEFERRAMSAWLKRGRHSKRGDRAADAQHARSRMRVLLQSPKPPQPPQLNQPPTVGPPVDNWSAGVLGARECAF